MGDAGAWGKAWKAWKTGTVRLKNYDNMLSRFHLILECVGQTDGQNCYINNNRLVTV